MSVVTLAPVKAFLRVLHTSDDDLLQDLIDASEAEALQYMDRTELPPTGDDPDPDECDTAVVITPVSDGASLAPDVRLAIYYLIQSKYEAKDADEISKLRNAALAILAPHRRQLGA